VACESQAHSHRGFFCAKGSRWVQTPSWIQGCSGKKITMVTKPNLETQLLMRGDNAKPLIEARSGLSFSVEEVAVRMKTSRKTVIAWAQAGRCVAYRDRSSKRCLRLPAWQFTHTQGIHDWVAPLITAFGQNGWALVDFLTVPRRGHVADIMLDGESLLQRIEAGDVQLALETARRANPD